MRETLGKSSPHRKLPESIWPVFSRGGGRPDTRRLRWLSATLLTCAIVLAPSLVMADDYTGDSGDNVHDHANTTNDTIDGAGGNDTLDGSGGADTISGGTGVDSVHGGDDNDVVYGDTAGQPGQLVGGNDSSVLGTAGDDQVYGDGVAGADGAAGDTPDLIGGNDPQVEGDDGVDIVFGDGEVVASGGGKGVLDGGDDHIWGDSPFASVFDDPDTIYGDGLATGDLGALLLGGDDLIHGGGGGDFIVGDGYADDIGNDQAATLNGGDDDIFGDGGNDTIYGDGGAEGPGPLSSVLGGDDEIHGGEGDDFVWGEGVNYAHVPTGGNDTIFGDAGSDTLFGQSGNDTIDGGDDNDTVAGEALNHSESLDSSATTDTVSGGAGDDSVFGDGSVGNGGLFAPDGSSLVGGDDTVDGGAGHDLVYGDGNIWANDEGTLVGGDDTVMSGGNAPYAGPDPIPGGEFDFLWGDGTSICNLDCSLIGGLNIILGGTGEEGIAGDGNVNGGTSGTLTDLKGDTVNSGDGNDTMRGDGYVSASVNGGVATMTGGGDNLSSGSGNDSIEGDGRVEALAGGTATLNGGADQIDAGLGDDETYGDGIVFIYGHGTSTLNGAADTISGGDGADTVYGDGGVHLQGAGTATLNGGNDTIDGGSGDDRLVGDGFTSSPSTRLLFGGDDIIHGGDGNDIIWGESAPIGLPDPDSPIGGNDTLFGDTGNDTIYGQSGNDILWGGDGDDSLDGGEGNDFLCGDAGSDSVKGGSGADLQCAVDDNITVSEKGGVIDVAVNEELDDADAADLAGRRYEIIEISGSLQAVMDNATGRLTVISADSSGQIRYRVWLIDGGFESFATVFVALSRIPPAPEPDPEPTEEPTDDPTSDPTFAPIIDPVVDPVEPDPPVEPVTPPSEDVVPAAQEAPSAIEAPPALSDPTYKSNSVEEFLRGPLAPAVTAGVAGTMMMAVTGGAGLSAGSIAGGAGAASGGGGGGGAASRSDGTSDRYAYKTTSGVGPGDRSFTWRFPGRRIVDAASVALPTKFAPHSPLLARLVIDGAHVRAMFGSLWTLLPMIGALLGVLAAHASGGRPLSPPLWMLIAGAVLTTIDAFAGAVASTVYIAAGVVTGALIDTQPPDLVHSLLVYCGVSFLWTSIPLIGSALRPFRRLGKGDFRYAWDVAADMAIASLLCAWITRGLMGAMDNFAGTKTGLPEHANVVALVVLAAVAVRIAIEHVTTRLYPLRLQSVEALGDLPEPTLLADLAGITVRTGLFAFIGYSFIGPCWQWWAGAALYVVPQILSALGTQFDKIDAVQRFLPRGITALFLLLLIGALVVHLATSRTATDLETMRWVFVLLAVPPAVLSVLAAFTRDADGKTTWTREVLGLGVVVGSAWLAFNGWSL